MQGLDEVERLADPGARVFQTDDGARHVVELFPGVANFQAADGSWQHVSPVATPVEGGFTSGANSFRTFFPDTLDQAVSTEIGSGEIRLSLRDSSASEAQAHERAIVYPDVYPHADLRFELTSHGYRDLLILKSPEAAPRLEYVIDTVGLSLTEQSDDSIVMTDASGDEVGRMPAPYAFDSSSDPERFDEPDRTTVTSTLVETAPGRYSLNVEVPQQWYDDPTRVFPVMIDPDVIVSRRCSTPGEPECGDDVLDAPLLKDTFTDTDPAFSTTQRDSPELRVGPNARTFLTFNIRGDIRDLAELVYEARIRLYNHASSHTSALPLNLHRITQHWDVGIVRANEPPVAAQTSATLSACGGELGCTGWDRFDVTELMQWWIDNPDPTTPGDLGSNHGVRIASQYEGANAWKRYRSMEWGDGSKWPHLFTQVNTLPTEPTPIFPVEGTIESVTPQLKVDVDPTSPDRVIDKNGDNIVLQFKVSEDPAFAAADVVWQSAWQPLGDGSAQLPPGVLQPGRTYYWKVTSSDTCEPDFVDPEEGNNLCDDLGRGRNTSVVSSFSVIEDERGLDERWATWNQGLGNEMDLHVNQANGNLVLDHPITTLAGTTDSALEVALSYNSQQVDVSADDSGMSPGWEIAAGPAARAGQIPIRVERLPASGTQSAYGARVVYQSGRRDTYARQGSTDHYYRLGPASGHLICRGNEGCTLRTATGSLFRFDSYGGLTSARASTATASAPGFSYTLGFPTSGPNGPLQRVTKVTDPFGRSIRFVYATTANDSRPRLEEIVDESSGSPGRSWDLTYDASRNALQSILSPDGATVRFGYEGARLTMIRDGEAGATGPATTITYTTPASAPEPLVGSVKLAGAMTPWSFDYESVGADGRARSTSVTDPRGVATPSDSNDYKTITEFTSAMGLPVMQSGPYIQGAGWPVVRKAWDAHGNLVCSRDAFANSDDLPNPVPSGCIPPTQSPPTVAASDGRQSEYFYEKEAPYLLTKVVGPDPADPPSPNGAQRLVQDYSYDTGLQGLRADYFTNANLNGLPQASDLFVQSLARDWGQGAPAQISGSADNFSLRLHGQIKIDQPGTYQFSLRSDENARLVVGRGAVLDNCWGGAGCASPPSHELSVELEAGWEPITVEYQDLSGAASFDVQWLQQGQWKTVPLSVLRPHLGNLSKMSVGGLGAAELSDTDLAYATDEAKLQATPTTITTEASPPQATTFTYDLHGRVKTETDATGAAITRTYSGDCEVSTVDRVGLQTTRVCDGRGLVTDERVFVDPAAPRRTQMTYDGVGRLSSTTHADGGGITLAYDLAGRLKTHTEKVTSTQSRVTSYTYWPQGWLRQKTLPDRDPADGLGAPAIRFVDGANPGYDAVGNPTHRLDELNHLWRTSYNALGLPVSKTSPTGDFREWDYNIGGLVESSYAPPGRSAGVRTKRSYDILGRLTEQRLAELTATLLFYDVRSNLVREVDPDGIAIERTYDAADQLKTETLAGNATYRRRFDYDGAGRMTRQSDYCDSMAASESSLACDWTAFGHDAMGSLISVTMPHEAPNTTYYDLNKAGELLDVRVPTLQPSLSAPGSQDQVTILRHTERDSMGRVDWQQDGLGQRTELSYDLAGQVTSTTDPRNWTVSYGYDGLGNQISRRASKPLQTTTTENFGYDDAGNLRSASNPVATWTLTYDDADRVDLVKSPGAQTDYDYLQGKLSTVHTKAGKMDLAYNAENGRLTSVTDPLSAGSASFTYLPSGRIKERTDPNGLYHLFRYDASGRLESERVTRGAVGAQVASFESSFDPNSHVLSRTSDISTSADSGSWGYSYDRAGRLIETRAPDQDVTLYDYDAAGNRVKVADDSGPAPVTVTTSYDAAGRPLASSDGTSFEHDLAGNLTKVTTGAAGWVYGYDGFGRQTSATQSGAGAELVKQTYSFDALDRVLKKTTALAATPNTPIKTETLSYQGITEDVVQSSLSPVDLTDPKVTTLFTHIEGQPLSQTRKVEPQLDTSNPTITTSMLGLNPHSDVSYLSDLQGQVTGSSTYDPWGVVRTQIGDRSSLGFQGDLTDADTSQVDMGARNYLPSLGRFTTQDPMAADPMQPLTGNPYIYGGDDPVSMWDPTGMRQTGCQQRCENDRQQKADAGGVQVMNEQVREDARLPVAQSGSAELAELKPSAVDRLMTVLYAELYMTTRECAIFSGRGSWNCIDDHFIRTVSYKYGGLVEAGQIPGDEGWRNGPQRIHPPPVHIVGNSGWKQELVNDKSPARHFLGWMALGYFHENTAGLGLWLDDRGSSEDYASGRVAIELGVALQQGDINVQELLMQIPSRIGEP